MALCVVAGLASGFLLGQFFRNKIPLIDWGHRCFGVPDEKTAKFLLCIFKELGLRENFTFSPGGTNQTLFNDGTTVLMWFDECQKGQSLPPNGLSIVTDNPWEWAQKMASELGARNYTAKIHYLFPQKSDKIAIVESSAFLGWVLVFRRHSLKMGERPQLRKITPQ